MKKTFTFLFMLVALCLPSTYLTASVLTETEPNNTEGTAQSVNLSINSGNFNDTITASISPAYDVDYYAINLSTSNVYNLNLEVFDYFNKSGNGTYTSDVKIYYKIDNGSWSSYSDDGFSSLIIESANILYVKIIDYYSGSTTGTYALNIYGSKSTYMNLPLSFTNNVSNDTIGGNLATSSQIDLYKIDLPAGYNYAVNNELFDSYNSHGGSYSIDGGIYTKLNSGAWSNKFDSDADRVICTGPATVYLKVGNYYSSSTNTGNYDLNYIVTRSTNNFIEVATKNFDFGSELIDSAVSINCTGAWTASSNKAWVTFTSASGTGSGKLKFKVAANAITSERTATITVSTTGDNPVDIIINQDAYIVPDSYESNNSESASYLLALGAFANNSARVSTVDANIHKRSDEDYYKVMLPAGYNYLVNMEENDSFESKDGKAYTAGIYSDYKHSGGYYSSEKNFICNGKDSILIWVEMSTNVGTYSVAANITRFVGNILLPEDTKINLTKNSRSYIAENIYSNVDWTVTSDQSWLTLNYTSGTGIDYFSFNVSSNTGAPRTANITISATGVTPVVIPVYQEGNKIAIDKYEVNNTEGTAAAITPTFVNDVAVVTTDGATLHSSDVDYYKIVLPVGYSYVVQTELYDNYNTSNDNNRYSGDAEMYYKVGSGSWSSYYDSYISAFNMVNGNTLYYKVDPYFSSDTGSYQLSINIVRTILSSNQVISNNNELKIYPNPNNGKFNVNLNCDINNGSIKIYDITGKLVYSELNINRNASCPFEVKTSLEKGFYMLEITDKNNKITERLSVVK